MKILNHPDCQGKECEHSAISRFLGKWLCGDCLVKYVDKKKKIEQELVFNE